MYKNLQTWVGPDPFMGTLFENTGIMKREAKGLGAKIESLGSLTSTLWMDGARRKQMMTIPLVLILSFQLLEMRVSK